MEWGLAKGLAADLQYDKRIADARYQDLQMKRAQAENMAELKAFEDDMDYMNAANSFDHELIRNEANKTIKEIGEIIRNNPDFRVNPDVRRQINEKKKYLKSNQHVIRGMASDENFKKLNDDLAKVAKNPAMYDVEAYQDLLRQKENYIKYGNQLGEEAAKTEGYRAFVYDKPEDFVNMSEEGLQLGNKIKQRQHNDLGNGGFQELVDEDSLTVVAMDLYNRRKRQIDVTYKPKSQAEAIAYAKELIRPGVELKWQAPKVNQALQVEYARQRWEKQKMAMANDKTIDPYMESIVKMKENLIEPEAITAFLGTTPEARIYDADGNFKGTTKGRKFIPNGSFAQANDVGPVYDEQGRYMGYKSKSNKTIGVANGFIELSETEYDESGYDDDSKMRDQVVVTTVQRPKGEQKVYRVPAQVHFDPRDEGKRLRFNNYVGLTTKQLSALDEMPSNQNMPAKVVQNGITYTYNPQTGQYE